MIMYLFDDYTVTEIAMICRGGMAMNRTIMGVVRIAVIFVPAQRV